MQAKDHLCSTITTAIKMYHEDGIEVYLKPADVGLQKLKYAELALSSSIRPVTRDHPHLESFIPFVDQEYEVVIRFSDHFERRSSSAVKITLGIGTTSSVQENDNGGRSETMILQQPHVAGRRVSLKYFGLFESAGKLRMENFKESHSLHGTYVI